VQRRQHQTEFAGDEVDDGQDADERQPRETSRLHRPTAFTVYVRRLQVRIGTRDVRNLELEIGRRFRWRVLRVHPFGLSLRSFCLAGTLSQALRHRAHLRSPEMTERSSRKS
jgi:hypothetical protein